MENNEGKGAADGAEGNDAPEDRIKNLQAETSRKLENLNQQFTQSNQALITEIQRLSQTIASREAAGKSTMTQEKKLTDLLYDDPEQAVRAIESRVTQTVMQQNNQQQAFQSTAAHLESEYPEFADRSSEHFKRVKQLFESSPLHGTKEGLEWAALKVAQEQGLKPRSKRQSSQNEDFSVSSGGNTRRAPAKESSEPTDAHQYFAELLIGDAAKSPEFQKTLKTAAKRKTYSRYRAEGEE